MKRAASTLAGTPGMTFFIAIWMLVAIAAAQLVAVIWKVVPATIVRVASAPAAVAEVSDEPFRPATQPAQESVGQEVRELEDDPQRMQEAMLLMAGAESAIRLGDWEKAQGIIVKAMEILPENPTLQFHYAFVLERLGRVTDATNLLGAILSRPGLDPQLRDETARLKDRVDQTIFNMEATGVLPQGSGVPEAMPGSPSIPEQGISRGPVLEDIGLQPGATLGIVEARELEPDETSKKLRIAIKSRPASEIDRNDVKVTVRFFEKGAEGEVFLTQSQVSHEWISPPVDWADNEPEILDVVYPLPEADQGAYHGYTVAIYYRDELQDTRAVPGDLDRQFPHDLFLE